MPKISRVSRISRIAGQRRRPALAAAAVTAALALTVTACGGSDDEDTSAAKPKSSAAEDADKAAPDKDGLTDKLPEDLPSSLKDLEKWKDGGWKNWDQKEWLRDAADFANPYIPDHWKPERMKEAEGNDHTVTADVETSAGETDSEPAKVRAKQVETPYTANAAPAGKIFMETPKGPMVCSGTVVKDPGNPGKSNLVATAGHCIHSGKTGGWFRNIMFVPAYNNNGLSQSQVNSAQQNQVYPYGQFWVEWIQTTNYWMEQGAESGGGGAQQDFAVLKVRADGNTGKSLEESVGTAVKIDFNAPPAERFAGMSSYGYPAEAPYEGARMFQCTDRPGRYTLDPTEEPMYRIGCTMTGGMSGGGMFATGKDGKAQLVSVNSLINRPDVSYAAGPRLGSAAKGVFDAISKKYAGKS